MSGVGGELVVLFMARRCAIASSARADPPPAELEAAYFAQEFDLSCRVVPGMATPRRPACHFRLLRTCRTLAR